MNGLSRDVFYSRQTILKELGIAGQEKLSKSRVVIVGVGGLGCVSSLYLALAGVGYIRVIDHDAIEMQNLHRQILYTSDDLNQSKAKVAAQKLQTHNSLVEVEAITKRLDDDNVESLLEDVDCVVDGLDNMLTRYIVNRACVKLNVPYIFGATNGLEGNLSVFLPPETGCLECIVPPNLGLKQQKNNLSVIGATPGIIGAIQAMETIKLLTGIGHTTKGNLLVCDFSTMDFTTIPLLRNPNCPTCGR